jgi:hypothetical protein
MSICETGAACARALCNAVAALVLANLSSDFNEDCGVFLAEKNVRNFNKIINCLLRVRGSGSVVEMLKKYS